MVLDITVKTLDSHNYRFEANDDWTILQFKEHIQPTINIPANEQRLIFCGRVLQDDQKLAEYDCNGKVIHLVRRQPPAPNQPDNNMDQADSNNNNTTNNVSANTDARGRINQSVIEALVLRPLSHLLNGDSGERNSRSLPLFENRPPEYSTNDISGRLNNAYRLQRSTECLIIDCMSRIGAAFSRTQNISTGAATLDVQRRVMTPAVSLNDLQRINIGASSESTRPQPSQAEPSSDTHDDINVDSDRDASKSDRATRPRHSLTTDDLPPPAHASNRVVPGAVSGMLVQGTSGSRTVPAQQAETSEIDRYLSILNCSSDLQDQYQGLARRYRQLANISCRSGFIMPPGSTRHANSAADPATTSTGSASQPSNPAGSSSLTTQLVILSDCVPRIMHNLAHLQHALSDFEIDFNRRRLLVRSIPSNLRRNAPLRPRTSQDSAHSYTLMNPAGTEISITQNSSVQEGLGMVPPERSFTITTTPIMTSSTGLNQPQANATIYLTSEPMHNGARISLPVPIPLGTQDLLNMGYIPRIGTRTNTANLPQSNPNQAQPNLNPMNRNSSSTASNSTQTTTLPIRQISNPTSTGSSFDPYLPCLTPFRNEPSDLSDFSLSVEIVPPMQFRAGRQPNDVRASVQPTTQPSGATTQPSRVIGSGPPQNANDMGLTEVVSNIVGSFFHQNQDQLLNIIPEIALNAASQIFGGVLNATNPNQPVNTPPQHENQQPAPPTNASTSRSVMMDIDIDDGSSSQSESRYHDARDSSSPVASGSNPSININQMPVCQMAGITREPSSSTARPSVQCNRQNLAEVMRYHIGWIPIIEADIEVMEQQRRENSNRQPFFSDAYLSSIPRKRRRLVATNSNALLVLQPSPSRAIADLLRRTLTNSTLNHGSVEQILETVSSDRELQAAYEEYIKSAVESRLQSDFDYSPEKFVNSSKYFK